MKRKTFWRSLSAFLALWLSFSVVARALADGEDPRLEISADRLAPGMILQVRGVNLEREQDIPIALVGAEGEFPLGVIASNEAGEFTQSFNLPLDLPEGVYRVLAKNPSSVPVISVPLTIQGAPVMAEAEEVIRDEDEPLLAPIPTAVKAAGQPAQLGSPAWLNVGILILLGAVVLGALGFLIRRSRLSTAHKN
jgi:hypothetical protein